jgi:hypothetical protein
MKEVYNYSNILVIEYSYTRVCRAIWEKSESNPIKEKERAMFAVIHKRVSQNSATHAYYRPRFSWDVKASLSKLDLNSFIQLFKRLYDRKSKFPNRLFIGKENDRTLTT